MAQFPSLPQEGVLRVGLKAMFALDTTYCSEVAELMSQPLIFNVDLNARLTHISPRHLCES